MTSTNLVPDPYFDAFTRPFINNKFEDKNCGAGPLLDIVFKEDMELQDLILNLQKNLRIAFRAISRYIDTFLELNEFYKANELVSVETIEAARQGLQKYFLLIPFSFNIILIRPTYFEQSASLSPCLLSKLCIYSYFLAPSNCYPIQ